MPKTLKFDIEEASKKVDSLRNIKEHIVELDKIKKQDGTVDIFVRTDSGEFRKILVPSTILTDYLNIQQVSKQAEVDLLNINTDA